MPTGPTTDYRVVLSLLELVALLVATALCMMTVIVSARQGARWLHPLGPRAIAVGVMASAAVGLYGSVRGRDTSELGLGIYFGTTAIALALLTSELVRHWRHTS